MAKGTLTAAQRRKLSNKGFIPSEVKAFNEAKRPDGTPQDLKFNSEPFQKMIARRAKWVSSLREQGWTPQQIKSVIQRYYNLKHGRSPWDFLKLEYVPVRKLTDFQFAMKLRSKARISRTLGTRYSPRIKPEWREPKKPEIPSR